MGKSKCGISRKLKTDYRAKRANIWDSGVLQCTYRVHMYILLMPDSLSLVWVIRHTLQNFRFYDFQNTTPSDFYQTSYKVS